MRLRQGPGQGRWRDARTRGGFGAAELAKEDRSLDEEAGIGGRGHIAWYDGGEGLRKAPSLLGDTNVAQQLRRAGCTRALPRPRAGLATVAQEMVGEHAGHHGLADRHGADADAGVVAALGDHFGILVARWSRFGAA